MCDNQVFGWTIKLEAIQMFIKEQFYFIKKGHYKPIGSTKQ